MLALALLTLLLLPACDAPAAAPPAAAVPASAPRTSRADDETPPRRADYAQLNVDKQGLALSGYDPVAYFPEGGGKPAKGKPEITFVSGGVTWRFASEKNRELFQKTPARFEPAYGGWCAWAMVDSDKVEVDPDSFLIEDGRLLLFYDSFFADTRKRWLKKGGATLKPKADAAWKKILETKPPPTDQAL